MTLYWRSALPLLTAWIRSMSFDGDIIEKSDSKWKLELDLFCPSFTHESSFFKRYKCVRVHEGNLCYLYQQGDLNKNTFISRKRQKEKKKKIRAQRESTEGVETPTAKQPNGPNRLFKPPIFS